MLYPATVKALAAEIIRACDAYKLRKIGNNEIKELILYYANNYPGMLFNNNELNPTVLNRIGKKRKAIVNKLLEDFQHRII